jgi:deoxyribodipyrimidine photo-lyase
MSTVGAVSAIDYGVLWKRWATAHTGVPLVDAAMTELFATGYTSNRCRQNCASLLVHSLQIDWRSGAEFFQWLLVDHDLAGIR